MSDGHGPAIVGFAAVGITYLLVESIVTFFVLGLAFGAVAVIVIAASIIGYMVKHPIHTPSGWMFFLTGSGTTIVLPFFFMYFVVMHRHTETTNMSGPAAIGSLFAFGWLAATVFWLVPKIYDYFEQRG